MNLSGRSRKGSKSALAGIASFFRQLSLFDPVPVEPSPPPGPSPRPVVDPLAKAPAKGIAPSVPGLAPSTASDPLASAVPSPAFTELCRGPYAHIQVLPRKRLWESWRVAWTRRNESLRLDVPAILEEAPRQVKEAVLEWSVLVTRRGSKRDPALRARRAELETLIREHLRGPALAFAAGASGASPARGMGLAARRLARNRRKLERLEPKGIHHDLDAAFAAVNARYFGGSLEARLTWSARLGGLSTHSMAQDGEGKAYHLISISRGYDNAEVTPEILGGVVYHECLHIAIPPRREAGRRVVHGADFRRREREYDHFEIWRRWHRDGLPKALRRMRRNGSR